MAAQTVLQSVQQLPEASSARVKDAVTERTAELEKRFGELYVMVCDVTHYYLPTCHLSLRRGMVTPLTVSTVKSAVCILMHHIECSLLYWCMKLTLVSTSSTAPIYT
jgi:hypothetical protein